MVRIIVPKKMHSKKKLLLLNRALTILLVHFAGPKPNVVVHVRRSVVQVQSKNSRIRLVVEITTPDRGRYNYAPFVALIQPPKILPISLSLLQKIEYLSKLMNFKSTLNLINNFNFSNSTSIWYKLLNL